MKKSILDKNRIIMDVSRSRESYLKIGFNHTCDFSLDNLLKKLNPKVMRTYFSVEDVKRSYDVDAEPFVGVRFMPLNLSVSGNRQGLPTDFKLWGEYVADIVSDFLKAGLRPKYYSVWNEPERKEDPIFWEGTLEDYLTLFEYTSKSIKRVDPNCLVGGPETTAYEPKWTELLIASSIQRGFDVDFLSFHQFEEPSNIIQNLLLARRQYEKMKGFEPDIHIGEWGFKIKNASLALQHLACAEQARVGFYCKDFFFEKDWKCSVIDNDHKKRDMFYLLEEYSKIGSIRFKVETNNNLVKAIAGSKNGEIVMLFSDRDHAQHQKYYGVGIKDESFKVTSLHEISNHGLIERGFKNNGWIGEFELESERAYVLKGDLKK